MLLSKEDAHKEFVRLLSDATEFCWIAAPWMSEDIAADIITFCSASEIIVMLADTNEKNLKCVEILSKHPHVKILRNPNLHGKAFLSDKELISGSSNPTQTGFFRNDEFTEIRTKITNPSEFDEYRKRIEEWIAKSVAFELPSAKKKGKKEEGNPYLQFMRRHL